MFIKNYYRQCGAGSEHHLPHSARILSLVERYSTATKKGMDVLGIEPRTISMRMRHYTPKPHALEYIVSYVQPSIQGANIETAEEARLVPSLCASPGHPKRCGGLRCTRSTRSRAYSHAYRRSCVPRSVPKTQIQVTRKAPVPQASQNITRAAVHCSASQQRPYY